MQKVYIKDDFIKLGQALKLAGLVESGLDAKYAIQEGEVLLKSVFPVMKLVLKEILL